MRPARALLVLALMSPLANCLAAAGGNGLSLSLYNVTLAQAFDQLALSSGMAFDYDGAVRTDRRMSLFVNGADAGSALYYALRANNLEMLAPKNGRVLVVPAADTDDTPIVVLGTGSVLVEVSKDEADVRQQRARMQPAPSAAPQTAPQTADTLIDWKVRQRSRVGSNFTLQLYLRSNRALDAVPLTISFDRQALEVVRIEAGGYWGPRSGFSSKVDPQGTITLEATRNDGAQPTGAGDGLLAAVTFRAMGASPAARIQIISAHALDAAGGDVVVAVPMVHAMLVQP